MRESTSRRNHRMDVDEARNETFPETERSFFPLQLLGRKPLPPQRQVNPLGRVAGRRSRGGGRDHDVPSANATALSSRPTPTGPSADFANGGLNIAGVPTGPRGLVDGTSAPRDAPTGPRSSTAAPPAVASGKWAPASLTTNKWATAPTTAPVSGSNKTAVVRSVPTYRFTVKPAAETIPPTSRPTASSEKRTSPKPEQPRWATEPAAANRWARAAPLPSRDSRGRSPPPRAKSPPPAPFRGRESRLALDAKALDESLESYNASRPPGSPDFDREALLRDRNEGRESPTHTNVEERRASTLTDSPKARATSPSVPSRARSRSPPPPATSVRVRSRSPPRRRLSRSPPLAPHPLYRDRPPRSSRRPGAVPVGAVRNSSYIFLPWCLELTSHVLIDRSTQSLYLLLRHSLLRLLTSGRLELQRVDLLLLPLVNDLTPLSVDVQSALGEGHDVPQVLLLVDLLLGEEASGGPDHLVRVSDHPVPVVVSVLPGAAGTPSHLAVAHPAHVLQMQAPVLHRDLVDELLRLRWDRPTDGLEESIATQILPLALLLHQPHWIPDPEALIFLLDLLWLVPMADLDVLAHPPFNLSRSDLRPLSYVHVT